MVEDFTDINLLLEKIRNQPMVKFPTVLVSWGKRCLVWVPGNSFTYPGLYLGTKTIIDQTRQEDILKGLKPEEIISCTYRLLPWFGKAVEGTYKVK